MGVSLGYGKGDGFSVGRTIYGEVLDVNKEKRYVRLSIERRDYGKPAGNKLWSSETYPCTLYEGHTLTGKNSPVLEGVEILFARLDKYGQRKASMDIMSRSDWPISRFIWKKAKDPWRPALKGDGIYEGDLMGIVLELSVQALPNKVHQAYALVVNPISRKPIAYLCIDENVIRGMEDDYSIIARVEDGTITRPVEGESTLRYLDSIRTAEDSRNALLRRPEVVSGFRDIPTKYTMQRKMFILLKEIFKKSQDKTRKRLPSTRSTHR